MMIRIGSVGLCALALAVALAAVGIGCGGSGQQQSDQPNRSQDRPPERFEGSDAKRPMRGRIRRRTRTGAPKPPLGSVTAGRFVNGDREFFIYKDSYQGDRLYAGSLYVPATCPVTRNGAPILQPDYQSGELPYIDERDGSFSLNAGSWGWKVPPVGDLRTAPGSATGKVADDNQSATVSWPAFPCGDKGDNVVFTRK